MFILCSRFCVACSTIHVTGPTCLARCLTRHFARRLTTKTATQRDTVLYGTKIPPPPRSVLPCNTVSICLSISCRVLRRSTPDEPSFLKPHMCLFYLRGSHTFFCPQNKRASGQIVGAQKYTFAGSTVGFVDENCGQISFSYFCCS